MACEYRFLAQATVELNEIVDYLCNEADSRQYASAFVNRLEDKIKLVCESPYMCPLSRFPVLAQKGYRTMLLDSFAVLYTYTDNTVFIEHIFHQRQDYAHLV